MLTQEQTEFLITEIELNINGYLNALRRISIPAQEQLNKRISQLADIKVELENSLK